MPQVNIYMPDDLHQQVKAAGFNLSAVCQAAARAELTKGQMMTKLKDGMEPVEVEVNGVRKRFTGRFLVQEELGLAGGNDVYLTGKGRFAVYSDMTDEHSLLVFDSFAELAQADVITVELLAMVAEEVGEEFVEDLDI